MERRLERSFAMLSDRRCLHMAIIDVAFAVGFGEVSHLCSAGDSARRRPAYVLRQSGRSRRDPATMVQWSCTITGEVVSLRYVDARLSPQWPNEFRILDDRLEVACGSKRAIALRGRHGRCTSVTGPASLQPAYLGRTNSGSRKRPPKSCHSHRKTSGPASIRAVRKG